MQTNLFIPKAIHVGFCKRGGTFDGQLAYVTYEDEKGKMRKEVSWNNWRDKKIDPVKHTNEPRSGYKIERSVQRYRGWSSSGRSMVRIYDDRGFEFEITVDNLVGILSYSSIDKGEIMGDYVFAQAGAELVLLPIECEEYQESISHTNKQDNKVKASELVPGKVYEKKKSEERMVYVGRYEWHEWIADPNSKLERWSSERSRLHVSKGKKYIFCSESGDGFRTLTAPTLSHEVGDSKKKVATLIKKFLSTTNGQKIVGIKEIPHAEGIKVKDSYSKAIGYTFKRNGIYYDKEYSNWNGEKKSESVELHWGKIFEIKDGNMTTRGHSAAKIHGFHRNKGETFYYEDEQNLELKYVLEDGTIATNGFRNY